MELHPVHQTRVSWKEAMCESWAQHAIQHTMPRTAVSHGVCHRLANMGPDIISTPQ